VGGGVVLGLVFAAFLGCEDSPLNKSPSDSAGGSGGSNTGNNPSGGTGGATPDPGAALAVGTKIWTADATKLVAEIRGDGGGYAGAPGSAAPPCARGWTYTLTMADRKLSWHLCDDRAPAATALQIGERILAPAELASVVQALDGVTVSNSGPHNFEKPTETLTITTPAGERVFEEETSSPSRTVVANVDPVFAALGALAH
jgi:hypothetical protein